MCVRVCRNVYSHCGDINQFTQSHCGDSIIAFLGDDLAEGYGMVRFMQVVVMIKVRVSLQGMNLSQCNENVSVCVLRGEQFELGLDAAVSHTHPG